MHNLLIAKTSYERLGHKFTDMAPFHVTTIDKQGVLQCDGEVIDTSECSFSMLWLNLDLFMLGQLQLVGQLLESVTSPSFVQTSAAGLDHPILRQIAERSAVFCNSDAQSPAIAEYVLACVLNRWQRFDLRMEDQQSQRWVARDFKEMLGSKWLIIGFGNIGQLIATQLSGFGARVTAIRRQVTAHKYAEVVDELANVSDYLSQADVVVLACPLNDATQGLVDADFLAKMKSDAVLVNIARGPVVDEAALCKALDAEQIDYAVLDVFDNEPLPKDSPLWAHDRVMVTAHASNRGSATDQRGDELFLDNLSRFLNDLPMRNLVTSASF